jgi:hypothetical protein
MVHQLSFIKRMVRRDSWMTDFYGQNWFILDQSGAKTEKPGVYELRVAAEDVYEFQNAQDFGFSLVETQMEFRTRIAVPNSSLEKQGIRLARTEDLTAVLEITRTCFDLNPNFYNRFKNRKFFDSHHAAAYYAASVKRCFEDENALISVALIDGNISGYFMMIKVDTLLYKGVMTAVLPEARGHHLHRRMQMVSYSAVGEPFDVINKTQIQNLAVLNNHIKEGRKLCKVEYLFLKRIK